MSEEKAEKTAGKQPKQWGKPFKKGQSGNPKGRPKGAGISITTEIKRKLETIPEGQKATYLQILIKRILKSAVVDGDVQMIKQLWAYVDGMPKQEIGISRSDEKWEEDRDRLKLLLEKYENSEGDSPKLLQK